MRIWTRQRKEILTELEKNGVYYTKEQYIRIKNDTIADYYIDAYKWYTFEASKIIKKPSYVEFPIWCSLHEDTVLKLNDSDRVILELEVPKEQIMITLLDDWGYRINYWYVPIDDEDRLNHKKELKKYGINDESSLTYGSNGNFYPLLKRKIENSWKRMFTRDVSDLDICEGTIWEIKKEQVVRVIKYEK